MENMDSTIIATSLPAIARAIGTNPLALKLAVTSYLLALAIFIPASGWTADRFGARNVFRLAIVVFMLGSIGCALRQLARGVRHRPHCSGDGRSDDDARWPAHSCPQHRQAAARQRDVARHHSGACRPDMRPAARRLHHHLRVLALDISHQHTDRPCGFGDGDALHAEGGRRTDSTHSITSDLFCRDWASAGWLLVSRCWDLSSCRSASLSRLLGVGVIATVGLRRLCAPGDFADTRSPLVRVSDVPRQHLRRLHVPARYRRAAISAAFAVANRLSSHAVSVRPYHLHRDARRTLYESRRRRRAPSLRLSAGAASTTASSAPFSSPRARASCRECRSPPWWRYCWLADFSARCNSPQSTPSPMPRSSRR